MADLVIFDMDGTLIDSETLAEEVIAETSQMLPRPMSAEEAGRLFHGKAVTEMAVILTEHQRQPVPQAFWDKLGADFTAAVKERLRPTKGAIEAIEAILPTPICVASNGEADTVQLSLDTAGLLPYFEGRWFSAQSVANPKPAPDLFLLAAQTFGAAPDRCVVVEDSIPGITGALAAGMSVIGFCGNHLASRPTLEALGVPVIDSMDELPALVLEA